jgi:hypothetical protein
VIARGGYLTRPADYDDDDQPKSPRPALASAPKGAALAKQSSMTKPPAALSKPPGKDAGATPASPTAASTSKGSVRQTATPAMMNAPSPLVAKPAAPVAAAAPPGAEGGMGQARAKFKFSGSERGELSLNANDVVTVLKKDDSGWWQVALLLSPLLFLSPLPPTSFRLSLSLPATSSLHGLSASRVIDCLSLSGLRDLHRLVPRVLCGAAQQSLTRGLIPLSAPCDICNCGTYPVLPFPGSRTPFRHCKCMYGGTYERLTWRRRNQREEIACWRASCCRVIQHRHPY